MLVTGRTSLLRAAAYIIAQLAGAMAGSGLNRGTDRSGFNAALGAVNQLNTWVTPAAAFGVEALLTALLVFIVFAATDDDRAEEKAHLPFLAPLAIGFMVFLAHVIAVPIDGCSINPARSFGTAVVSGVWEYHWIFWVGPITGALVAGVAYALLSGVSLPASSKQKVERAGEEYPYAVGHDMPASGMRVQQSTVRPGVAMPPSPLGAAAAPAGVYHPWEVRHTANGSNAV
jgi:aquaporin PIP